MIRTVVALAALLAQTPSFELASVRLSAPSEPPRPFTIRITNTRVDIENVSMLSVLRMAFRTKEYQLRAPGVDPDMRVHIHATLPAGATRAQVPEMLRRLLIERFGLVTHLESRNMETYELVVASGGIKMREAQPVDDLGAALGDPSGASSDAVAETVEGPVRTVISPSFGLRTITARTSFDRKLTDRLTVMIDATRMTMPELASVLETTIDEPVVDKTGLTGVYQFRLELPHDATVVRELLAKGRTTTPNGSPLVVPGSWPEVVEGLGLKLEKRRSPIEFVVVDKIARTPTEN